MIIKNKIFTVIFFTLMGLVFNACMTPIDDVFPPTTIYYSTEYGDTPDPVTTYWVDGWEEKVLQILSAKGKIFKGWYFYKDEKKHSIREKVDKYSSTGKSYYIDDDVDYFDDDDDDYWEDEEDAVWYNAAWYMHKFIYGEKNLTLYAEWADAVNVTFWDNESILKTIEFECNADSQLPTASSLSLAKEGYGFKGWALSASAKEIKYTDADSITPQSNISLYAIWSKGIGATPSTIEDTILGLTGEATIILTGKYPYNAANTIGNALKKIEVPVTLDFSGTKGFTNYYFSFKDCTSLKGIVIPQTLTQIYDSTFSGCTALENVTIPSSITEIGSYAFTNCKSLKKIELPSSVKKIDNLAFSNCTSLSLVTIPESVQWIRGGAFNGCLSLSEIIFEDTSTWYQTSNISNWTNRTGGSTVLLTDSTDNVTILNSTWSSDYYYYFYKL